MEDKKLTREQRRIQERISNEAQQAYSKLAKSYFDFFIDNDPDSEPVKLKAKEVIHKWRMYCKHRNLIPKVYDQMLMYVNQVEKDYNYSEANAESDVQSE